MLLEPAAAAEVKSAVLGAGTADKSSKHKGKDNPSPSFHLPSPFSTFLAELQGQQAGEGEMIAEPPPSL